VEQGAQVWLGWGPRSPVRQDLASPGASFAVLPSHPLFWLPKAKAP